MKRFIPTKQFLLLIVFFLFTTFGNANISNSTDGYSQLYILVGQTQGDPKTSAIQASIDGHYLTVVFTENLGQVSIEIESSIYGEVNTQSTPTPNGVIIYIPNTGSYTVTFTLPNGDKYYSVFEISDN